MKLLTGSARHEPAVALLAGVVASGDDLAAPREHVVNVPRDRLALIAGVVDGHVVGGGRNRLSGGWVVDDEVGVGAWGDSPLAW